PCSAGLRMCVPGVWGGFRVAITLLGPHRTTVKAPARRIVGSLLIALVTTGKTINLIFLLSQLLHGGLHQGRELIVSAVSIWLTNVIVFGLWYWELDRGGPFA